MRLDDLSGDKQSFLLIAATDQVHARRHAIGKPGRQGETRQAIEELLESL